MNWLKPLFIALVGGLLLALWTSCQSSSSRPMPQLADHVDLDRFMGTWYVHGYTPILVDKAAWNATETYEKKDDGRIATTYRFHKGGPEGPIKTYHPVGRVVEGTDNAEWRMTFFWFLTQPYLVLHVEPDYSATIIGHPARDKAWIMSRSRAMDDATYKRLVGELEARDFDLGTFKRLPQEWE